MLDLFLNLQNEKEKLNENGGFFEEYKDEILIAQKRKERKEKKKNEEIGEDAFESEDSYIEDEKDPSEHPKYLDSKIKMIAMQISPLFDRIGRMLIDLSPHFAKIAKPNLFREDAENQNHFARQNQSAEGFDVSQNQ
jgi:hypothetical protein